MSLAQIEAEIAKLTSGELEQLRSTIDTLRPRPILGATPDMLTRRGKWLDEVMAAKWSVELEDFEKTQADDRENDAELFRRWRD